MASCQAVPEWGEGVYCPQVCMQQHRSSPFFFALIFALISLPEDSHATLSCLVGNRAEYGHLKTVISALVRERLQLTTSHLLHTLYYRTMEVNYEYSYFRPIA